MTASHTKEPQPISAKKVETGGSWDSRETWNRFLSLVMPFFRRLIRARYHGWIDEDALDECLEDALLDLPSERGLFHANSSPAGFVLRRFRGYLFNRLRGQRRRNARERCDGVLDEDFNEIVKPHGSKMSEPDLLPTAALQWVLEDLTARDIWEFELLVAQGKITWDANYPQSGANAGAISVKGSFALDKGWAPVAAKDGKYYVRLDAWQDGLKVSLGAAPVTWDAKTPMGTFGALDVTGLLAGETYNVTAQVAVTDNTNTKTLRTKPGVAMAKKK